MLRHIRLLEYHIDSIIVKEYTCGDAPIIRVNNGPEVRACRCNMNQTGMWSVRGSVFLTLQML